MAKRKKRVLDLDGASDVLMNFRVPSALKEAFETHCKSKNRKVSAMLKRLMKEEVTKE